MQRLQICLRNKAALQRVAVTAAGRRNAAGLATRSFSSLPDHEVVGLPALSPTMETGTIANWNKQEGDAVSAGDVICQVETDKAVVDFEAQDDTILAKILKPAGSGEIKVGEPICVMVSEVDDVAAFKNFTLDSAAAAEPAAPAAASSAAPAAASPAAAAPVSAAAPSSAPSGRVFASPLAKKVARESGAVLSVINGSGPHGRIVKADVEAALASGQAVPAATAASASAPAAAPAPPAAAAPTVTADYVDYPISAEAQALAQQLAQQKLEVPHYHLTVDLTIDKLLDARARLNAGRGEDEQLSVNDFIVRAASLAMRTVPDANSVWKGTFIRQYNDVNVNLIVSTATGGSVAPVLSEVNRKGLSEISKAAREAVAKANDGAFASEELATGTFTISNVGMYDVKSLSGIVRPEQGCLLGLGAIEKKVVPNDDPNAEQIYKYAQVMTATLACDHRVIDGAVGAQWLSVFKELVEDPLKMIL